MQLRVMDSVESQAHRRGKRYSLSDTRVCQFSYLVFLLHTVCVYMEIRHVQCLDKYECVEGVSQPAYLQKSDRISI